MAEYIAFDPNAEVIGQGVVAMVAALGDSAVLIFAKHGLADIDPDAWYPMQSNLDAFREVSKGDFFNMVAVGMKTPDVALFPPEIDTVEKALTLLGQAYQMNHRGGEIGEYTFTKTGERSGEMVCRNPYPSDFDYGLIYRLVQKFRPTDGEGFKVVRDDSIPNRTTGADACLYRITW